MIILRALAASVLLALPVTILAQGEAPRDETPATAPGSAASPPAEPQGAEFPETDEFRQEGRFPEERTDVDHDGVPDIDDNCPATPAEQATPVGTLKVKVDECGCPRDPCTCDTDVDGVPDCRDVCAGTAPGELVGPDGCTLPIAEAEQEELGVRFDFEKHEVKAEFEPVLLKVRERLLASPNLRVTLEGHADWKGPQSFNQPLSEKRAAACRDFVLGGTGIVPDRVQAVGFGELRPIADNTTEEGRAKNRRVSAVFSDLRRPAPEAALPPQPGPDATNPR
jgi:outer membrane protein OmpA-like peptidoglycan-associated protein